MRAMAHHQVEDAVLPRLGGLGVLDRLVRRRLLGDAREQRGLRERQVLRGLAEVALGRCLDADVDAAVRDRVQIPLEDLLLRVPLGQLEGDHRLP